MPLFQLGYRRYEGARTSPRLRWWPITRTGLTIAWRSKLLRRLVYFAYVPLLYFGPIFFFIGRVTEPGAQMQGGPLREMASELLSRRLVAQLQEDPASVRSAVWAIVFAFFIVQFQLILAGIVAAIVGPGLIANDLRTRAFLIYFARPVSRWDYVLGKGGVLIALLSTVTLLPSLALYALSIVFSPSLETVLHTAPIALSIVLASAAVILPATAVVLWLSSLSTQARFATVAWAVVCGFGMIVYATLSNARGLRDAAWTFLFSLPHTVRTVQLAVFDVPGRVAEVDGGRQMESIVRNLTSDESPWLGTLFLAALCGVLALALRRRVAAPTRI